MLAVVARLVCRAPTDSIFYLDAPYRTCWMCEYGTQICSLLFIDTLYFVGMN